MSIALVILGFFILSLTFIDFFHTTLSARGYGFLSERLHKYLALTILKTKSKFFFTYSGAIHIIVNAFTWLMLLLLGSYVLYSCDPFMVIDSKNLQPADPISRFYFTCYVISTAGIGDYMPGTELSRFITAGISFSGFIMLTISITYLLSVLNAVNDAKVMGSFISTMGNNVDDLYAHLESDGDFTLESSGDLRTLILKHTSNHLSFPIVQRFLSPERDYCPVLQLASLYEVLNVIRSKTDEYSQQWKKLESLLNAIHDYLELHKNEYYRYTLSEEDMKEIRSHWENYYNESLSHNKENDELLHLSLHSVGRTWRDIYKNSTKFSV